jgi:hypothetical protein
MKSAVFMGDRLVFDRIGAGGSKLSREECRDVVDHGVSSFEIALYSRNCLEISGGGVSRLGAP